ncbi:hypothetical protein RAM80_03620 [Pseudomonas sp. App30]|uniref:hypothetical protein n=1 Tax=Pseudomonas sp. App30 TaxID=3068990 RepID=UPI003A7F654D
MARIHPLPLLALVLLTACAGPGQPPIKPVSAAATPLTDAQVRQTLIGNKLTNIGTSGRPYSLSFRGDGTEIFQMGGDTPVTEHWTVQDGVITFTSPNQPVERYRLLQDKDDYWLVDPQTGAVHYHYSLAPQ